jgi:ATP-dependent Zn protease
MTVAQRELPSKVNENATSLAREWRRLGRAATGVALLTSPAVFVLFHSRYGWPVIWALVGTVAVVVTFRGFIDVLAHRFIPSPSLYGAEAALKEQDVISRRRLWYWRRRFRLGIRIGLLVLGILGIIALVNGESLGDAVNSILDNLPALATQALTLGATLVVLFFINFLILFGPLVGLGIQQIKSYEPGDADWGVRLDDVRGQAEAKEEITRVVSLWQSGEEFEKAGGKRERGVLFLGAPGTGKTMLSKAIATSFNCPFVTIPGSGFAQTFIGMDAVLVRFLAFKAKRLARKWGGQCIVFIDEIDAVGMRRQSLGSGFQPLETRTVHDMLFYGPDGALTSDGDLVVETAAWRDRLFAMRAQPRGPVYPPAIDKLAGAIRNAMIPGMGGMGGGGLALNQLLVVMDGIDEPPLTRRFLTRRLNTFLDALYFVPQRIGKLRLRLKPPRPRKEEVYFVGACNVPLEQLDPALTRPGRMGRHIYFRTPTWEDRRDVFDLYLGKVAHEEDLDTPRARDELARITNGYSPAMIDQACSLALTYAHSDGRIAFSRHDLVAAMTTVEAGVAIGQPYPKHEERATAIHEAGHAVCGHLFMESSLSTRLSIRKRGSSGGHHQMMAVEDRFGRWRSEQVGNLIWGLGAMAAEHVFYDQNTTGVGGDVASVTMQAAQMVGMHAMAPAPIDLSERLGEQIMHRSGGGLMDSNPFMATLGDRNKARLVAGLLGQAFVVAWCTVRENREATERIAERLIAEGELYGDEVTELLESTHLRRPEIDVRDEATWPVI